MPKGKSIERCEDMITTSSSNSDNDNHESLGADQKETLEAQASIHNVASSSVMPQRGGGVPS